MGTWGFKPNENDSTGDMLFDVYGKINQQLDKLMRRRPKDPQERWERIGVVYEITAMQPAGTRNIPWSQDAIKTSVAWLYELQDDDEWLSIWRSPAKAKKSVRDTTKHFERLLRRM